MPRDITARHEHGSTVRIKLPRITVEVSRRHAERLRDALNAILPVHEAPADRLYLLCMWGDVEPQVCGPYRDEQERTEAAQDSRRAHGDENGLYRLDTNGSLRLSTFTGAELEMPTVRKRCTLCNCDATGERFGLPVCTYHLEHTEDDPQCPTCAQAAADAAAAEQLEDGRQLLRELRDMPRSCERCGSDPAPYRLQGVALCQSCDETLNAVAVGDRVRDPLDGTWREIVRIDGIADGGTCHMRDGGCMSVAECVKAEKRLPSEALD